MQKSEHVTMLELDLDDFTDKGTYGSLPTAIRESVSLEEIKLGTAVSTPGAVVWTCVC